MIRFRIARWASAWLTVASAACDRSLTVADVPLAEQPAAPQGSVEPGPDEASPECAGLLPPSLPAYVESQIRIDDTFTCLGGVGDGTGHLALGYRDPAYGTVYWEVATREGQRLATFWGEGLHPLAPQPAGWHGVEFWEDHLWANHRVISGTGQTLALWSEGSGVEPDLGTRNRAVSISPDPSPSGGSFVVATERAKGSSSSFEVRGHRFAADGAALASVLVGTANMDTQPNEAWVAAGVSAAGPSLGILPWHGPLSWTWHGREGNELARAVLGPRPVREDAQPTLHPLLDGSLVAQVEGEWQLRFPLSGASSEPPPPWLPNGHRVAVIRNRRGHALLPLPREGTVPCEQRVEIRSASGLACGAVVFRLSEAACSTRDISVGRDGTVIQQTALEACSEGTCTCTHRWWPGLFQ